MKRERSIAAATIAFSCALRQTRTVSRGLPAWADEIDNANAQIAAAQASRVPSLTPIVAVLALDRGQRWTINLLVLPGFAGLQ
jgi:hypothetical protein